MQKVWKIIFSPNGETSSNLAALFEDINDWKKTSKCKKKKKVNHSFTKLCENYFSKIFLDILESVLRNYIHILTKKVLFLCDGTLKYIQTTT
jgi:hypothetical protein